MTTTVAAPAPVSADPVARHRGILALRLPDEWGLTDECLEHLCQLNPEWKLERGHFGELVVSMGSGGPSWIVTSELLLALGPWAKQQGGFAGGADASFNVIDPHGGEPMRNPDLCWISESQFEQLGGAVPWRGFWPVCPAFVIEVRSPGDNLRPQQGRMIDWLRFGAQLGWLVDPQNRDVWIYRPEQEPERLDRPALVEGESPIDGFSFDFEPIWALVDRAEAAASDEAAKTT